MASYSDDVKSGRGGGAFTAEQDDYMDQQIKAINKSNLPKPPDTPKAAPKKVQPKQTSAAGGWSAGDEDPTIGFK